MQSYEEIIYVLQSFVDNTVGYCGVLRDISWGYSDIADEDPKALKANERLRSCTNDILDSIEPIREIISALRLELELIKPVVPPDFDDWQ